MAIVYLSLGSNIGDRIGYIQQATSLLSALESVTIIRTSAFYETEPWGMDSENWFVNAVLEVKTKLSPKELLQECKKIETLLGKSKKSDNNNKDNNSKDYQDRTIDIDILFYNSEIINEDDLTIPHKYLHLRAFTLVPLLELIPDFEHPVLHKNIADLHSDLENPEMVFLYGTRVEI